MGLNKGDFVELDYAAYDKETGRLFDSTSEDIAKKQGIYNAKVEYKPIVICIGKKQVLEGLDVFLVGKDVGKDYSVEIAPGDGFGKRDQKLLKLIPLNVFKQQKIMPFPGLRVNFDGIIGTVRSVSGGRIVVDFNHPLAGHSIIYTLKAIKVINDAREKLNSLLVFVSSEISGKLNNTTAEIYGVIPEDLFFSLRNEILSSIPEVKEVQLIKTPTKS